MSAVPGSSKDSLPTASTADQPKISSSPQPGPSNEEQDLFLINKPADEPKPGPSTTAAEFDLEVFDSGSSCSLEDCWPSKDQPSSNKLPGGPGAGSLKKSKRSSKSKIISETGSESSSEESTSFDLKMDNHPKAEMESACPSETEEAISDEEEEDKMEDEEDDEEDHCQCPKSLIALPPLRLSDVNNHCWKCAGPSTSTASLALCSAHASSAGDSSSAESTENIDEIVQDHDNFGTDENEEDSLDSSTLSSMMLIPSNSEPRSGFKRKSGEETLTKSNDKSNDDFHPGSALAIIPKRKREMFSEIEQEVCLQNPKPEGGNNPKIPELGPSEPESISSIPMEPPKNVDDWLNQFSSWSHAQRLAAIDLLIGHCHPTQVRHMMAVIEPQFQRDFISLLPKELALYVLSFLHPRDLLRAAQTCRYWRILAEDNLLWREKCRESGLDEADMMSFRKTRKFPIATSSSMPTTSNCTFQYSPWKSGYMRQHNIEINWRVRGIRTPKVLKGHDDHVITCLQFSNNRIVSGSDDNTLKVWNATSGKCMRTLAGHTGGVWSSQMQGNIIVSGSTDRTLKVWNADSGNCLHTLHGHTSTVRCMHLHGQR